MKIRVILRVIVCGLLLAFLVPAAEVQAGKTSKQRVKIGVLASLTGSWFVAWQEHRCRTADCSTRSRKHRPPVSPGPIPIPCSRYAARSEQGARRYSGPGSTRRQDYHRAADPARKWPGSNLIADAHNILVISQGSTASSLAIPGDNILRFCPNDTREAEALVALLQHDGIRAIVPLWRNDAGNNGLHDSVQIRFQALEAEWLRGFAMSRPPRTFPPRRILLRHRSRA